MKHIKLFDSVKEYKAPEVAVVEMTGRNVILEESMVEDYEENIIC